MTLPLIRMYRLAPRGAGGLACDKAGVALGPVDLVRAGASATGRRRCDVRQRQELERILSAAYGPQSEDFVLRLHRGLQRAALAIQAGDLCLAGIETVLLALPDLTPLALVKLAEVAELEKGGTAWEDQPRVPPGQSDNGRPRVARAARSQSTPSLRRMSPLTRPLPAKRPRSRSTTASIDLRPTRRASSLRPDRRRKRSLVGRTGRRTISPVSKKFSPASRTTLA